MGAATDSKRWFSYLIGGVLVAIGETLLSLFAPAWEWTWILLVGVVAFVAFMAQHAHNTFRQVATWLISFAGVSAAIPSFVGKLFPQQFRALEIVIEYSPKAAAVFVGAAVVFGLFELVRMATAGKSSASAEATTEHRKKPKIPDCEQVQIGMIPVVDQDRFKEGRRLLQYEFGGVFGIGAIGFVTALVAAFLKDLVVGAVVIALIPLWIYAMYQRSRLSYRQDLFLVLRDALLRCDAIDYESLKRLLLPRWQKSNKR